MGLLDKTGLPEKSGPVDLFMSNRSQHVLTNRYGLSKTSLDFWCLLLLKNVFAKGMLITQPQYSLVLLLFAAGFIRIEVKTNDQEHRLTAVEQILATMPDASVKGKYYYQAEDVLYNVRPMTGSKSDKFLLFNISRPCSYRKEKGKELETSGVNRGGRGKEIGHNCPVCDHYFMTCDMFYNGRYLTFEPLKKGNKTLRKNSRICKAGYFL